MDPALALGGWLAAILMALVAVVARRSYGSHMEAVARACHELRGPLTAARLGLQFGARTGELSALRLRAIDLELGRASLALEDLADVREQHRRAPSREDVDLSELLADSVEAWLASAASAGVDMRARWTGAPARVFADRIRIAQAIGNLIANAIEHGGEAIEVRGRAEDGTARIEVTDRGPGLPAPVAELARRPRHGRGQRGRGLAIASAIAERHGGRLAAAPADRGARLVLELPLAADASRPVSAGDDTA